MIEHIITCECGDTPAYAKDAYSILFPDKPVPEITSGDSKIGALADSLSPSGEAAAYIRGIAHNKEKYAVAITIDDDNNIVSATNLMTGKPIL